MKPRPKVLPRRRHLRAMAMAPASPGVAADARRADRSIVIAAVVILLLGFALLLWAIADVVLLMFSGLLLAVFLRGLSDALSRASGLPDRAAFGVVVLSLFSVLLLSGVLLGAETASQLEQLGPRLAEAWDKMLAAVRKYDWGRTLLSERNLRMLGPENDQWLTHVGGLFSTTLGTIAGLLITLFIGLYGAADPDTYRRGFLAMFPYRHRERAGQVVDDVTHTLRWWMIGTFVKMSLVGVSTGVGLWLLDMPLALALGLIAFLLDFVPYVGPILAALPALLVALAMGPDEALYVALLYLGIQTAESYVISPLIDQRAVHLPPAVAIAAQVLMGALLGALGVVFATPLAASGIVLMSTLYVEDEPPPQEGEDNQDEA